MFLRKLSVVLCLTIAALGCSKQAAKNSDPGRSASLRPLTPDEALADFREMAGNFRSQYGGMYYKQERFKFSFEELVKQTEADLATAKNDAEIFGVYARFIATFHDGHLGIQFPVNSTQARSYSVPLFVTPVAGTFLVASVGPELTSTNIAKGDEILGVDDSTPAQLLATVLKYQSFATPESNLHWVFKIFSRDFYMTELIPTQNTVRVTFKKPDGRTLTEDLVWKVTPWAQERLVADSKGFSVPAVAEIQEAAGNSLLSMAQPVPFFATPEVLKSYGFRVVTASDEYRAKYGLKDTDKPNIFAALYKFNGKTVLLVRNYIYAHSDFPNDTYLRAYKAILDQWEGLADVLVLDQTHNGGGAYCEEFFRLFIQEEKDGFVESLHVDRKWVVDLRQTWGQFITGTNGTPADVNRIFVAMGSTIEQDYDRGLKMSDPMPIIGGHNKVTPANYSWKKPMLLLVDELAGSCGDAYPMLIKNNGVAKLFGHRTMGLGGNVEELVLTNSQAKMRMVRGLFTSHRDDGKYLPEYMIENNGVTPDYPYDHTVDDFRHGFVNYVRAFSLKALEQIK